MLDNFCFYIQKKVTNPVFIDFIISLVIRIISNLTILLNIEIYWI